MQLDLKCIFKLLTNHVLELEINDNKVVLEYIKRKDLCVHVLLLSQKDLPSKLRRFFCTLFVLK